MPMVRFEIEAPGAQTVFLAGDFNRWDPAELRLGRVRKGKPRFAGLVSLPPGRHEFRYIVDGEWVCCPLSPRVRNASGEENSVVEVGERACHTGL